jgi:hydrogenase small subunit
VDAWPIGIGYPCYGCTEQSLAFRVPRVETVDPNEILPPATYPPIFADRGPISPVATGIGGAIVGGAIAAGVMASKKVAESTAEAGAGEEG